MIYHWVTSGFTLLVFKVVVDRVLSIRTVFANIKGYPGRIPLWLSPFNPIVHMLGAKFPRPGMCGYFAAKFSFYKNFGATCYASVLMSTARPFFWVADPESMKIILSDRHTFQKDVVSYEILNVYGENIVATGESGWKRHRSVAMSAFNEANIALVWSETMRLINEWFEQLDAAGPHVPVDVLQSMKKISLYVLVSASFGRQLSFNADSTAELPPNFRLTFQSAVLNSVYSIFFKILVPRWFYKFSSMIKVPYLSDRALFTRLVFDDLRTHMLDLVASARADIMSGQRDAASSAALLRNLVEANMNQDGGSERLSEDELLSNMFIFLLAGYEASAHTVSFALLLLALYPRCQEKIYEEVTRVWPADMFTIAAGHKYYADKLVYIAACVRETLRLFPSGPRIPKLVRTDTILPGTYFTPGIENNPPVVTGKFTMVVPAGSVITMDIWALHMNPLYWGNDAAEFKPERFIDTESYQWPRNAYLPFSGGARSCIGERFAFTEMVGIVASVVRKYRIHVPDDLANKPLEAQKEALLAWRTSITLAPTNAFVKLSRRV